jgi:class 3 adenylate cyclase/tetratricopeptide (TPR) repeat protein
MPACAKCGRANPDEAKFCSRCGAPVASDAPVPAAARKVVTVVFADVTGFTALGERLDAESLQQLVGRWFHEAQRVIARHGGTVEKFIGDAVMAVFGVPVVHEDDALRAARAALEMRDSLVDLNVELEQRWGVRLGVRTGLNTGEVVIGRAPGGEMSTVGDAVNVAQRLEASAPPGQVLVGEEAARLLGAAARLDPIEPLELKGKAAPVPAWRLVSVVSEFVAVPDRAETPFVDREVELSRLRRTFDAVATGRTPRLVTVLGAPGIGKSSLVSAFLASLGPDATAVVGRCLPYGDGITYWPLAEIVRELAGVGTETAIAALAAAGAAEDEAELIAARLARVAGFTAGTVPVEEAQWAVRKLLQGLARRQPLVVVIEDIHWAEPTFLDLLEHLATLMAEVPVLLICLARPELLDERPSWAAVGGERATTVALEPLSPREAGELLEQLVRGLDLTTEEGAQLLVAAEGNPFFLQQMVAVRAEVRDDATAVPPTIQAVLTARIDRLPPGERAVIERGSIEGRTFHRGSLAELLPDDVQEDLDANLAQLVRRELIRPGRADFENEEAYRFDHLLIRDATYSLLPKHLRADLHERHAGWLERRSDPDLGEHWELAGYHFEQAFLCRVEVEPAARESYRSLATRGGHHLGAAGRGALARDDLPAAINLLERATALLPGDDTALGDLMPELGMALTEAGRLSEAERILDLAVTRATSGGDGAAEAHAEVARLSVRIQVDTDAGAREVRERFDSLRATFERGSVDLGLGRLWRLRALVHWIEARATDADAAWERAAEHAERAGDERGWSEALSWLASSAYIGPAPVEDGIARCESIRAQLSGHRRAQALVLHPLAGLRAMRGEFTAARRLLAESNAILTELGMTMHTAVSHHEAYVARVSGDAAGAEAVLRTGYERLEEMGEKALLATTAAMLAHVIYEQGRLDDAWAFTQTAEDAAAADDLSAQIIWRTVRARLLARRGEMADAERMSAEAVALAGRTDWLTDHADALLSQAQVFRMAGETKAAAEALESAIALYTRKGNTIGARRARSSLDFQVPVWDI